MRRLSLQSFLIDHAQLLAIVSSMTLPWSCLMRQAFSFLSFEGFSIAAVFGSSCALSLDWQGKLVLMTFSPLVLIAMGLFAAMIKRAVWKSEFSLLEVMAPPPPFSLRLTCSSWYRSSALIPVKLSGVCSSDASCCCPYTFIADKHGNGLLCKRGN